MAGKLFVFFAMLAASSGAAADSMITWSAFSDDEQNVDLFLRRDAGDGNFVERHMGESGTHITPTLQAHGGLVWLAWIDRANQQNYALNYAIVLADMLQPVESGIVKTREARVYSPSMGMSAEGTPWLAWAGFDGEDEEIRISHYENGHWVNEEALTNNNLADTQPWFNVSEDGDLWLHWEQLSFTNSVTKHKKMEPVAAYFGAAGSASNQDFAQLRGKLNQQKFGPDENLPASLEGRKEDILMGKFVELVK